MSIGGNSGKSDLVKMFDWPTGTHSYILGVLCQAMMSYEQVDRDAALKYNWAGKGYIIVYLARMLCCWSLVTLDSRMIYRLLGLVINTEP